MSKNLYYTERCREDGAWEIYCECNSEGWQLMAKIFGTVKDLRLFTDALDAAGWHER